MLGMILNRLNDRLMTDKAVATYPSTSLVCARDAYYSGTYGLGFIMK